MKSMYWLCGLFVDDLPSLYRIQVSSKCCIRPFEAFAIVKILPKSEELNKEWDDIRERTATAGTHILRPELRKDVFVPRHQTAPVT